MRVDGGVIWLPVIVAFFFRLVKGTIMCSECSSDKYVDCEIYPPPPKPCGRSASKMNASCSIIRIRHKATGELHLFIRSCASTQVEDCMDVPPGGYETCVTSCYTDGCNSAHPLCARNTLLIVCFSLSLLWKILSFGPRFRLQAFAIGLFTLL